MSLRRHFAWMGLGQAAYLLLQFAGSVFIARLLTPYEMGIYAVAMATTALIGSFQAFGLSGLVVRETDLTHTLKRTAFTANALVGVVFSLMIAGLSFAAGAFLHDQGVRKVMLALALLPLLGIFEFLPASLIEREAGFHLIAPINMFKTVVSQSLAVFLAWRGFSYMSLAYAQVAATSFSAAAFMVLGRKHLDFRVGFSDWKRISAFGLQMLTISGVASIGDRLSETALGRIAGLSALGLYSRASNLNNLVWENIHLVTGRVLLVDLAEIRRSGSSLRERYIDIVKVNTAFLWPAFTGLAIVSGPFILAVYGAKWVQASRPLVFLALAAILNVAITLTWELFVVCQETNRQARIETIRSAINLALFVVGCLFGLVGAAAGRAAGSVINIILYRSHLNRMTDTKTIDFLPTYAQSAFLTIMAVTPALLIMWSHGFSEHTPLPNICGAGLVGVVLWTGALFLLKHPISAELSHLFSRLRGRFA